MKVLVRTLEPQIISLLKFHQEIGYTYECNLTCEVPVVIRQASLELEVQMHLSGVVKPRKRSMSCQNRLELALTWTYCQHHPLLTSLHHL